jgi:hypothetical protein
MRAISLSRKWRKLPSPLLRSEKEDGRSRFAGRLLPLFGGHDLLQAINERR